MLLRKFHLFYDPARNDIELYRVTFYSFFPFPSFPSPPVFIINRMIFRLKRDFTLGGGWREMGKYFCHRVIFFFFFLEKYTYKRIDSIWKVVKITIIKIYKLRFYKISKLLYENRLTKKKKKKKILRRAA